MGRKKFGAEVGFEIFDINSDTSTCILRGSALPGGDASYQDDAGLGSLYLRDDGCIWRKITDTNTTADWVKMDADSAAPIIEDGVIAAADIDCADVDAVAMSEWEVYVRDNANPDQVRAFKVTATHDGTSAADATAVDYTVHTKLALGASFNRTISVTLIGTGATQQFCLNVASTETTGVDVRARRNDVLF